MCVTVHIGKWHYCDERICRYMLFFVSKFIWKNVLMIRIVLRITDIFDLPVWLTHHDKAWTVNIIIILYMCVYNITTFLKKKQYICILFLQRTLILVESIIVPFSGIRLQWYLFTVVFVYMMLLLDSTFIVTIFDIQWLVKSICENENVIFLVFYLPNVDEYLVIIWQYFQQFQLFRYLDI